MVLCGAESRTAADFAFFSQATVAAHNEQTHHGLPCIGRLGDGRLLLVWSRYPSDSSDFAVVGSISSDGGCSWTPPKVLIDHPGLLDADPNIIVYDDHVLVTGTTVDFSQGIRTSATWCIRSEDNGKTWTEPYEIPMGHRYTCGKCQRAIRLASGTLLMGYSWDILCEQGKALQSEGEMELRAGVMRSTDGGMTWAAGGDTHATYDKVAGGAVLGTDEPAIVECEDRSIYMLMRTGSEFLYEARSVDEGQTWQDVKPSPLRGTNAPASLARFELQGRTGVLAVWDNAKERFPLCAAISFDGCRTWSAPRDIGFPYTGGQASYPSCVQADDGALVAVWQQDVPGGRDIRLARFGAAWVTGAEPASLKSPRTAKIVLLGESTTKARGPLRVFGQVLEEELPAHGVAATIINAGVGGESTPSARERFEREVIAAHPDVVTIYYGLNDAAVDIWNGKSEPRVTRTQFEENLRYFVRRAREAGIKPILLTPNPLAWTAQERELYGKPPYDVHDVEGHNVVLKDYVAAVRALAEEENVPLADVYRIFAEYAKHHSYAQILLDGVHPNDFGHRLIADELLRIIPEVLQAP